MELLVFLNGKKYDKEKLRTGKEELILHFGKISRITARCARRNLPPRNHVLFLEPYFMVGCSHPVCRGDFPAAHSSFEREPTVNYLPCQLLTLTDHGGC